MLTNLIIQVGVGAHDVAHGGQIADGGRIAAENRRSGRQLIAEPRDRVAVLRPLRCQLLPQLLQP